MGDYKIMGDYMKENSIWLDTVKLKEFESLNSDLNVDVLVIGGGITGLLCAYELKNRGYDCVVVEKDRIASKTTKDTTAFITAQHETLYQDLLEEKGFKKAKEYLNINLRALKKYKELSLKYDIDYQECKSILFDMDDTYIIRKEKSTLDILGYPTMIVTDCPLNLDFNEGVAFENQATINPLKLVKCLSEELDIYEQTSIMKIKKNYCLTNRGNKIYYNNLVIATHYPIYNKKGFYFMKLTQRRSYCVGVEIDNQNNDYFNDTYCGINDDSLYFRTYKDYLIIGGNDRDNKEICLNSFKERIQKSIINDEIKYNWSGQDCISLDGIPYIGRHNIFDKNIYVATGFNLWGFTWAMASSFIIADMIEKNVVCELTDPRRIVINKQLLSNVINSVKHILKFKKPRCKHMGCALIYNKIEHTWECPCHGSRYDSSGEVLDGPSQKNLNI